MNLERGFSAAKEKGDVWDPETPEKPVTTRRNQVPIRMQETQIGGENWQDLLGFYTDVLQDGGGCGLPPSWNSDNRVGINQGDRAPVTSLNRVPQIIRQIDAVERHNVADVAFAGSCDVQLPHSSGSAGLVGMNHWNQGAQDVPPVDKLRGLDQNARNVGSYLMNVSDVVPPRKVDSLAELLGMRSIFASSTTNPSSISQHSPIERNWNTCIEDGMIPPLQNHVLHANQDIGGHNLQQMPTSRVQLAYRPSYNLNSPLRSEAWESSSIDRPFHLVPATQDPYKLMNNNQISQIPHLFMGEISTNENIKQNLTPPQEAEIGEERNDFVSNTQSTASPNISTTKEKQNLVGKNGEFDLNKTPPQKAPKRKKHRPKVVVEGKPKRTPKSAAKENKNASGNTPPKRKYVRRKGIQNSKSQTVDAENDVEVLNSESQGKTCKRALKFELESGGKKSKCQEVDKQTANNHGTNVPKSSNLDFLNSELERKGACTMEAVHQSLYRGQRQTENTYNFGISLKNDPPHQQTPPHADKVQPTTSKDHTLNIIARNLNVRNTSVSQYGVHGKYGQTHHTDRGPPQLVISVNASQQNLDGLRPPRRLSTQLLEDLVDKQEPKRAYSLSEMIQPLIVSQMSSRGLSDTGTRPWLNNAVSSRINTNYAECKSNGFITEDFPSHNGNRGSRRLHEQPYELYMNGGLPYVGSEEMSTLMNPTYETNKVTHHWCMNSVGSGLKFQKMEDTKPIPVYEEHANSSLTTLPNTKMVSASSGESKVIKTNEITDAPSRVLAKRPYTRRKPTSTMSSKDKLSRKGTRNLQDSKHDLKTVSGSLGYKRNTFHIDDIIYHMKNLKISINGNGNAEGEHSALVPYTGDGATVPYEAFDPVKKRRPRPKVDLDPETNKLWNLLMGGNEANESAETMDENKQKWWEEERTVFRGRVDSFIARMHLVQGDRRFSKWKGSVVDSVIGVFLTQNVSDHLSSSAFMSLAAKFPIKSTHTRDNSSKKSGNPSAEYVVIRHPDGTTFHQRITKEPVNDHSSVKSSKLCEYGAEYVTSGTFSANTHTRTEEDMISSQSLSATMSFPASEDIRSSSGSNSEVEDQVNGSNFRDNPGLLYTYKDGGISAVQNNQIQEIEFSLPDGRPSNDHQQIENPENRKYTGITVNTSTCTNPFTANVRHHHERPNPISKDSWQGMLMGIGDSEIDVFAFSEKECTSALTSTLCDTTSQTVTEDLHDKSGQSMKNSHVEQQNGSSSFQPAANHQVLTKPFQKEVNLPEKSERRGNQYIINNSDKKPSENITFEPTEMKTVHASNVQSSEISTTSTARKQKAEKEKVKPFDWDTLRQQVLKGGPRGRSRETLDSLDYEALRNADVLEISNTIKERGMNNMLAARMKDFLNRLVKDHGSIDLEWLRDAQPDRVKDYLLSIRGLGLKSVECVRLLTLHHLAFPVDTNVGRIAVRLGWVPLQPLPESLQLHLLEMYPVLESIQKYLWPRLCMLDQETLYELHYQLITFGKVFCTKRQPNCNGCPMRGECRHFASAFASARHALPGPEEKRMVCSDIPTSSSKICGEVMRPMPLPPPEEYIIGSSPGATRNCEPIVEEPTTPESSIEITERDIEDAFYEDPDEIPEIKLNIEEFTTNLQSFIQENKELQESDMSKAIISLSPQLASIPMPKLKHVSRLRTEHHVYELPDSHPLLEGMDRREPDDPSPYLLALWTPGETADSIQPPEGKCSSSEGGLCNEKICFSCNSTREAQAQSVRGTILIPCRTAMRGSFPLNGTYFQVNEVFADHETSRNPIDVPRSLIWNLPRRTVFFGTSVSTIFKGMSTEGIQYCFWKGFVCVRGFDQKTRAPRPLTVRLHRPPSRIPK